MGLFDTTIKTTNISNKFMTEMNLLLTHTQSSKSKSETIHTTGTDEGFFWFFLYSSNNMDYRFNYVHLGNFISPF